jgi:hypothetical protein
VNAFTFSGLQSVVLPASVKFLGECCFSNTKSLVSLVFERGSRLREIRSEAFHWSGLEKLILPSSIEVIKEAAFEGCLSLKLLEFQSGTQLRKIKAKLSLPNSIQSINCSAFIDCHLTSISFFPSPTTFEFRGDMLEDISGRELMRYFAKAQEIEISNSVEAIRPFCFADYESLKRLTFETGSRLEVIDDSAFRETSLKAIVIPRSVKIMGQFCFDMATFVSLQFRRLSKVAKTLIDLAKRIGKPRSGFDRGLRDSCCF